MPILFGTIASQTGLPAFSDIFFRFRRQLSYEGNNVPQEQLEHGAAALDDSALTALERMNGHPPMRIPF